jgi:hypothetical protein
VLNYIFGGIFTIEAMLKLLGLGAQYWHDSWNIFDFVIVFGYVDSAPAQAPGIFSQATSANLENNHTLAYPHVHARYGLTSRSCVSRSLSRSLARFHSTLLGISLRYAAGIDVGSIATVMRTFRVGRIFRLVRSAPTLRKLFQTLIVTLPSLANIGLLLALLFFIYAILGVQLYAKVRLQGSLGPNANFQTFTGAVLLLVRSSTGENWNGLMYACALSDNTCESDPKYDATVCGFNDSGAPPCTPINGCGDGVTPFFYFISFTLLVTFILLNVFIAVILEGFSNEKGNCDMVLNDDQCEVNKSEGNR